MQNKEGANLEPIPDFFYQFLEEQQNKLFVLFRCHPNDKSQKKYCTKRLKLIDSNCFKIIDGNTDLYQNFLQVDLHITAYSSCCYEASIFGIRTLLFGEDSKEIYSDEILEGKFDWIPNDKQKLTEWIKDHSDKSKKRGFEKKSTTYIETSLSLARKMIKSKEFNKQTRS